MSKTQITLILFLVSMGNLFSQSEIILIPENKSIGAMPYIFSVKSGGDKINVKYLCFPPCLVKSSNETTMEGVVLADNESSKITGISLSDIVMILVEQETDVATKSQKIIQKHLIALRAVDPSKTYSVSMEGVDNICRLVNNGDIVSYNKSNLSKIPGLSNNELKGLEDVSSVFQGENRGRKVNIAAKSVFSGAIGNVTKKINGPSSTGAYSFGLTEEENILKYSKLDDGVEYVITRDRRIKKDVGVAYKTYLVYGRSTLHKADSVFYPERSDLEKPQDVFNINKNKYTGFISRLSCEPLEKDKKLTFFRYTYYDADKSIKRIRFQTEDGKLKSLSPERSFRNGDTIIHLTERKGIYRSTIFSGDSIKLRYPLTSNDTLKFRNVYCPNGAVPPANFFGSQDEIIMNVKFKDNIFLTEQSVLTKSFAGLTSMSAPDANDKGFALTKVYVINNNGVKSVNRIMVPFFGSETSSWLPVISDEKNSVYLVNMAYPVFFIFNDKGGVSLKDAKLGTFMPQRIPAEDSFSIIVNGVNYICYRDIQTGVTKLVQVKF